MNYSFTLLSTKEDCDTAIAIAKKNKNELEYRKITLEHKKQNSVESAVEIETSLQAVNAEIAALESVIAGLPEGETKKDNISKNYQELKLKMTKFRDEEEKRRKELSNNSRNAV